MYKVIITSRAEKEIITAKLWYKKRSVQAAKKFHNEIFKAIDKVNTDKLSYGPVYEDLSRVFVKKYPYVIFFIKDIIEEKLIIVSVMHNHQDRSSLENRQG